MCPSYTTLGIGRISDVVFGYIQVDHIFICVFHCDIQRHDISWVVGRFEMSDVGNVIVLSDDVTDRVNAFTSVQITLVFSNGPSTRNYPL